MHFLAAKLLMFGTALLLALPPGWCCAAPAEEPVARCPNCAARESAAPTQLPPADHAAENCCCDREATPPVKQVLPDADDHSVALLSFAGLPIPSAQVVAPLATLTHDTGPPLRILQCVLRL